MVQLIAVLSRRLDIKSSYKLLKISLSFSNFYRRDLRRSSFYQFLRIDFHRHFGNGTTRSVPLAIRDCHRFSSYVMSARRAFCVAVLRYISLDSSNYSTSCHSYDHISFTRCAGYSFHTLSLSPASAPAKVQPPFKCSTCSFWQVHGGEMTRI